MMAEENVTLNEDQARFLMEKFDIDDPDEAIDFLIEMMLLEGADPMDMKKYILKMMQEELRQCS